MNLNQRAVRASDLGLPYSKIGGMAVHLARAIALRLRLVRRLPSAPIVTSWARARLRPASSHAGRAADRPPARPWTYHRAGFLPWHRARQKNP